RTGDGECVVGPRSIPRGLSSPEKQRGTMSRNSGWLTRVRPGPVSSPGSSRAGRRERSRHRMKPRLLVLEDRRLLTSFFDVTSAADDGSNGTLRWAVGQANVTSGAVEIDFTLSTPAAITLT